MLNIDSTSSRAQFTEMTTPSDGMPNYVNNVNHMPSPSMALNLDTPRTVEVVTSDGIPTGAWASGLFDCFDNLMPNCFMVTFCPCVALAQLSTRLGVASYRVVLSLLLFVMAMNFITLGFICDNYDHGVVNSSFGLITLIIQMLLFVYIWQLRAKTRRLFQLPGNAVTDCLTSSFCSCCTVAQLRTHVRCYQPGSCTFRAPDVLQAYPGKSYAV